MELHWWSMLTTGVAVRAVTPNYRIMTMMTYANAAGHLNGKWKPLLAVWNRSGTMTTERCENCGRFTDNQWYSDDLGIGVCNRCVGPDPHYVSIYDRIGCNPEIEDIIEIL